MTTEHAYKPDCDCRDCTRIRAACSDESRTPADTLGHIPGVLPPGYNGIDEEAS